jgi:hypothetical protein
MYYRVGQFLDGKLVKKFRTSFTTDSEAQAIADRAAKAEFGDGRSPGPHIYQVIPEEKDHDAY